jgi:hypothetical protein
MVVVQEQGGFIPSIELSARCGAWTDRLQSADADEALAGHLPSPIDAVALSQGHSERKPRMAVQLNLS